MVSGWISLNVEPKTYRTGEDTATSQLRAGKKNHLYAAFVIALYNAITKDLTTQGSAVSHTVIMFLNFELIFTDLFF